MPLGTMQRCCRQRKAMQTKTESGAQTQHPPSPAFSSQGWQLPSILRITTSESVLSIALRQMSGDGILRMDSHYPVNYLVPSWVLCHLRDMLHAHTLTTKQWWSTCCPHVDKFILNEVSPCLCILAWISIQHGTRTLTLAAGFSWFPFTGQTETSSQYWKIIHIKTFRLVIPTPSVTFWASCISPSFTNDLGTWLTSPPELLLSSWLVTPHFGFSVPYLKWSFSISATLAHGVFLDFSVTRNCVTLYLLAISCLS